MINSNNGIINIYSVNSGARNIITLRSRPDSLEYKIFDNDEVQYQNENQTQEHQRASNNNNNNNNILEFKFASGELFLTKDGGGNWSFNTLSVGNKDSYALKTDVVNQHYVACNTKQRKFNSKNDADGDGDDSYIKVVQYTSFFPSDYNLLFLPSSMKESKTENKDNVNDNNNDNNKNSEKQIDYETNNRRVDISKVTSHHFTLDKKLILNLLNCENKPSDSLDVPLKIRSNSRNIVLGNNQDSGGSSNEKEDKEEVCDINCATDDNPNKKTPSHTSATTLDYSSHPLVKRNSMYSRSLNTSTGTEQVNQSNTASVRSLSVNTSDSSTTTMTTTATDIVTVEPDATDVTDTTGTEDMSEDLPLLMTSEASSSTSTSMETVPTTTEVISDSADTVNQNLLLSLFNEFTKTIFAARESTTAQENLETTTKSLPRVTETKFVTLLRPTITSTVRRSVVITKTVKPSSSANASVSNTDNVSISNTANVSTSNTENASTSNTDNASTSNTQNASTSNTDNASTSNTDNASTSNTDNASISSRALNAIVSKSASGSFQSSTPEMTLTVLSTAKYKTTITSITSVTSTSVVALTALKVETSTQNTTELRSVVLNSPAVSLSLISVITLGIPEDLSSESSTTVTSKANESTITSTTTQNPAQLSLGVSKISINESSEVFLVGSNGSVSKLGILTQNTVVSRVIKTVSISSTTLSTSSATSSVRSLAITNSNTSSVDAQQSIAILLDLLSKNTSYSFIQNTILKKVVKTAVKSNSTPTRTQRSLNVGSRQKSTIKVIKTIVKTVSSKKGSTLANNLRVGLAGGDVVDNNNHLNTMVENAAEYDQSITTATTAAAPTANQKKQETMGGSLEEINNDNPMLLKRGYMGNYGNGGGYNGPNLDDNIIIDGFLSGNENNSGLPTETSTSSSVDPYCTDSDSLTTTTITRSTKVVVNIYTKPGQTDLGDACIQPSTDKLVLHNINYIDECHTSAYLNKKYLRLGLRRNRKLLNGILNHIKSKDFIKSCNSVVSGSSNTAIDPNEICDLDDDTVNNIKLVLNQLNNDNTLPRFLKRAEPDRSSKKLDTTATTDTAPLMKF
ncbi:hypothetical protein AX774_g5863 [Zancudomyces culisetae]|uniref:Uncharacterized protein n=1 Tax=Zancudomyces culisetae TaxID=1213189 RepID=A0A1R1PIF6_ZANCU|nr:hypothetical protein AX774_g5863 [Zancudomyces culisetae]|eukprot:OMH80693.1 hypothetical protein AX774_g5863 [Zancudomyces culisetae]